MWGCKRGFDLWWRAEAGAAMASDIATAATAIINFFIACFPSRPSVKHIGHVHRKVE
jgi:hypothetical protein